MVLYLGIVLGAILAAYLCGVINGALYVPTSPKMTEDMLNAAKVTAADTVVDLGSGDGRLVISAAERGAKAVGYEINPLLVLLSNYRIRKAGLQKLAHVYWRDFWAVKLSHYSVVSVFGIRHIMGPLEKKLERELKPGSRVVCNLFPLPTWKGTKLHGMYAYVRS